MKLIFPLGLVALLGAGQVNATCMLIPEGPIGQAAYLTAEVAKPNVAAPEWQPEQIYQKGDVVRFAEELYQARWWTQFESPGPAWASWERIKHDNEAWQQEQVYEQGDKVLFEGQLYQAQYWNQGNSPAVSGAWALDPQGEKMLASEFWLSGYSCARPPSDFGGNYWEESGQRSLWLKEQITDEVLYDYVIIEHDEDVSLVPFEANVEGVACSGQQACNALLDGQPKAVVYLTGYSYTYHRSHGTLEPTLEPTRPPHVVDQAQAVADESAPATRSNDQVLVKYCNQDHVCRTIDF
ncbi:carbohydrate-binding protein [Motilimonas eburnea]|uniref:carbohydrate-binding protein n=1 Tax=Motilimonas eburnea TaxID=1737488 RepID=UPI001E296324|nr:carbohydrate-binding protein [Motilimonas eburnea]MCE2571954.1 hypothetical protein [Motilimonas eburnea]